MAGSHIGPVREARRTIKEQLTSLEAQVRLLELPDPRGPSTLAMLWLLPRQFAAHATAWKRARERALRYLATAWHVNAGQAASIVEAIGQGVSNDNTVD